MFDNICNLCARHCNVDRSNTLGYCNMTNLPVLAKACLHFGEEPCITGTNGSGTVFFSGCSLKCVFCQNNEISHNRKGKEITVERLSKIFKELEQSGAENINLVTPTHYVDSIINALEIYKPSIPIVYNSSGYDSESTIIKLKDYVDVYLIDFKYFSDDRAIKYSSAPNYANVAKKALLAAAKNINRNLIIDDKGIMQKGLIIRHLIMPQGTNDAINIIDWCNKNLSFAAFSLMSQYTPVTDLSCYPEINRKITKREYNKVLEVLENTDFNVIYTQDLSSSSNEMIPNFDMMGI